MRRLAPLKTSTYDQPNGVSLAKHHDMIRQLSSASADPALRYRILPGASVSSPARFRPDRLEEADHSNAENRVAIEDQVARVLIERKRLAMATPFEPLQAGPSWPGPRRR